MNFKYKLFTNTHFFHGSASRNIDFCYFAGHPLPAQYAKELTGWLAALGPPLPPASPCQHYNNLLPPLAAAPPPTYLVPLDKRNSELINSLLTLPKQLNEVGK